jgi:aminomethyltransferase
MGVFKTSINGQMYRVSRSGYTGEDGFEISGDKSSIIAITERLLKDERVQLAGLGARDSLRMEAGLCLHGHEITEKISPFESGLMWTVYKRQDGDDRARFMGEGALRKRVEENKSGLRADRRRVGFVLNGSGIIRENCRIVDEKGEEVGSTTSGGYSPVLKKCIGMAYVEQKYAKAGS